MQNRLKIFEIFHSIQGESTLAGERFSFVRLSGCPLRCTYCDTTHAYTGGQWMTIPEILMALYEHKTQWVLITGGEPLAQKNTIHLAHAIIHQGKHVSIETSGEEDISVYAGSAKIIMDIKTPGSGEVALKCFSNLQYLKPDDEIKFVLCDRNDYDWAKDVLKRYKLESKNIVLMSPVFNKLSLQELSEWILMDKLNVRLQTQLHKHIWGPDTRGV